MPAAAPGLPGFWPASRGLGHHGAKLGEGFGWSNMGRISLGRKTYCRHSRRNCPSVIRPATAAIGPRRLFRRRAVIQYLHLRHRRIQPLHQFLTIGCFFTASMTSGGMRCAAASARPMPSLRRRRRGRGWSRELHLQLSGKSVTRATLSSADGLLRWRSREVARNEQRHLARCGFNTQSDVQCPSTDSSRRALAAR